MVDFFAVRIDDVRDIFGADQQLVAELTHVARAAFPQHSRGRRAFLPLIRKVPEFTVDANQPTNEDLSIMLAGGYIAPERMYASWRLFHVLLLHRATANVSVEMTHDDWEAAEFDLSRHGLDSFYSLRKLGDRQLGIPLRGAPDSLNGYAKHIHIAETLAALEPVLPLVEETTRELVQPIIDVCRIAADQDLDLVILTS